MEDNHFENKSRNPYFDTLKAIAILCVVYAHCLQYLGIESYLHHPLFRTIYAFHMPLFMAVSGYFSVHAMQLSLNELARKKSIRLLLPCLTAGIVVISFNNVIGLTDRYNDWKELVSNLWYLKSLFVCMLMAKLALSLTKNNMKAAAIISLLLALPFYLWHVNFMMPFFWLGILWYHYSDFIQRKALIICAVALIFFILLWPLWDGYHTTYITPLRFFSLSPFQWTGLQHADSYLLRVAMGTAGSIVIAAGISCLYKRGRRFQWLETLGQHTLEIYTIHFFFIHTALLQLCAITYVVGWYELVYCLFITGVMILLCELIRRLFSHSSLLNFLFFGVYNRQM